MDSKTGLSDAFPDNQDEEEIYDDDVVVPVALQAVAVVFAELINHAYKLENFLITPGIDEINQYGMQFSSDSPGEEDRRIMAQVYDDIAASGIVTLNRVTNIVYDAEIEKFLALYETIAEAKGVKLTPLSEWYVSEQEIDSANPALQDDVMTFIRTETTALGYLHEDIGFAGREQLTRHFLRSSFANEEGHFVPTYSLSMLRNIVALNGRKDENQPGVTALWLN